MKVGQEGMIADDETISLMSLSSNSRVGGGGRLHTPSAPRED